MIRVVSRLLSSLFFSENMLSFTRRSKCFVDGKHTVPSEQLRGGRPTCAVSTPARVAIPESSARRERHLLSLAVEFLCRWHVAMPADMPYGNEETEVAAFYAAIADLDADQRRRLMLDAGAVLASADAPQHLSPKDLEEYDLIALRNECGSPLLHDWRCDTVRKQYMKIKDRQHVLVHYAHPCATAGRQLLPLSDQEAREHLAKADEQKESATGCVVHNDEFGGDSKASAQQRNALLGELVGAVRERRSRKSSTAVAQQVEQQCSDRERDRKRRDFEERKRVAQRRAAEAAQNSRAVDSMLNKVRRNNDGSATTTELTAIEAMRLRRAQSSGTSGSLSCDEQESDDYEAAAPPPPPPMPAAHDEASADSELDGAAAAQAESSCSSDTFSSEDDDVLTRRGAMPTLVRLPRADQGQRTWAEVVRGSGKHYEQHVLEQCMAAATSITKSTVEAEATAAKSAAGEIQSAERVVAEDTHADDDGRVSQEQDVVDDERQQHEQQDDLPEAAAVESGKSLRKALRQTAVELMLPLCEATDNVALFDDLECPFVLQWAAPRDNDGSSSAAHTRLHVFRKQRVVTSSMFGYMQSEKSRYQLIASIELLV